MKLFISSYRINSNCHELQFSQVVLIYLMIPLLIQGFRKGLRYFPSTRK